MDDQNNQGGVGGGNDQNQPASPGQGGSQQPADQGGMQTPPAGGTGDQRQNPMPGQPADQGGVPTPPVEAPTEGENSGNTGTGGGVGTPGM